MTQMSAWDKFILLSWKNWKIQFRHPFQTILEILIPVLVCAFLILMRTLVEVTFQENPIRFLPNRMDWVDESAFIQMTRGIVNNTIDQNPQVPNLHRMIIGYSPFNLNLHRIMTNVVARMDNIFTLLPAQNSSDLESNAILFNNFINFEFDDNLLGDVELPTNLHYAVRFPAELRRADQFPNDLAGFSSNWATNIVFGIDFIPGPRNPLASDGGQPPGYIRVRRLNLNILMKKKHLFSTARLHHDSKCAR